MVKFQFQAAGTTRINQPTIYRWIPIPPGVWKLSCDATWSERRACGGAGWILRDWKGWPIAAGFKCILKPWKISWLESIAICEGLRAIPLVNTPQVRVETGALQVVKLVNEEEMDETELICFIQEAQSLINVRSIESVTYVPHINNEMAHSLAHRHVKLRKIVVGLMVFQSGFYV